MSTIHPRFYESGFVNWLGGIGRAILGRSGGKFNSSQNYIRANTKEILIDTSWDQLMLVALNVPHLHIAISKGAEMFANAEIKHLDANDEEIEDSEVIKLLHNPNPIQNTLEDFLYEFYVNNAIYSTSFEYKNFGRKKEFRGDDLPSLIWWLPPGKMKITRKENLPYRQKSIEGIIEKYELSDDPQAFTPDEILMISEGISPNGIIGTSKIEALKIVLSNIVAALKSNNIILTERGLIGFISTANNSKDPSGILPPDENERKRIDEEYQRKYNLDSGNSHVTITTADIKWVPMTFDVAQLKLYEGYEEHFCLVLGEYGLHRNIFPASPNTSGGMTTGNEINAGLQWTYQNTMQPLLDKLCNNLAKDFGLTERGEKLVGSYDWLACMQTDQLKEAQVEETEMRTLSQLYKDGQITPEQYAVLAELDDFKLEPNAPKNASQANLRGLVGSVTGIIQVNQFVAQGFIDNEAGKNILVNLYGFDDATAAAMITSKTVDMSTPAPSTTIAAQ